MSEIRLIDANALKETFEKTVVVSPMPYAFVKQMIDNAPTVEPERPQGEWIEKRDDRGYLQTYCNICGTKAQVGYIAFCGKCGADMRGEKK